MFDLGNLHNFHQDDNNHQAGRLHSAIVWQRQKQRKSRRWQRRGRRRPRPDSWSWSRPDVSDDEKCWWRLWEDEGEAKRTEFDHVPIVCDRNHEGAEGGGSLQICTVQCTMCCLGSTIALYPKTEIQKPLSHGKKLFLRLFFLCSFRMKTLKLVSLFIFRHWKHYFWSTQNREK